MNKIVKEHYPVEKLPDDISRHFPKGASVTLEVSQEPAHKPSHADLITIIRNSQERHRGSGTTPDTVAAELRGLRDEWDD